MRSEDELLVELRDSLDAYAASIMRLQRVAPADFPLVDQGFYEATLQQISGLGFNFLADFVPVTGHGSDGNMRCFVRSFVAHDGPYSAACYHPRPRLWLALLSRIFCGRLGKVVEFETEFSDGTWVISTTAPKTRLFDPPPLMLREHYPEVTTVDELFQRHRQRVAVYWARSPGATAKRVYDFTDMERSQARQHDLTSVYRTMVGGLTADEMRRFSVFGKRRSAELKERMDRLGLESRQ